MDQLVDYLCIIQARTNSSRLPAKIMLDLAGKTLLERVYETVSRSKKINKVIVATSNEASDDIIEQKLENLQIGYFRGDLNNVLKRFFDTTEVYPAKNIIRITADNPLMDHNVIDDLISYFEAQKTDYSMFSNAIYGLSAEIFTYNALKLSYDNSRDDFDREHVTPYIKDMCQTNIVDIQVKYKKPTLRVTVDTLDDYLTMQKFYLYCANNNIQANIDNFISEVNLDV